MNNPEALAKLIKEVPELAGKVMPDEVSDIADAYVRRVLKSRSTQIETLAAAFLAETGLCPSEARLIEQRHEDGKISWWFEKRESTEH